LIHRILFTTEAQRAQKINWVSGLKETGFLVGAKHSGNRLSVKSDRFLARMLRPYSTETGFLNQIWVRMQRLWQKPGFSVQQLVTEETGFLKKRYESR
jgi:hypothetical protein